MYVIIFFSLLQDITKSISNLFSKEKLRKWKELTKLNRMKIANSLIRTTEKICLNLIKKANKFNNNSLIMEDNLGFYEFFFYKF